LSKLYIYIPDQGYTAGRIGAGLSLTLCSGKSQRVKIVFKFFYAGLQRELYGRLVLVTLKKLINNRLTNLSLLSDRVYRKIIDVYFSKLNIEKNKPEDMFKHTKLFIQSLPRLKFIEKFIKKGNLTKLKFKKDIFFLKLCLDIYQNYYATFDFPCYRTYKNKILKAIIYFYENLSDGIFDYIVTWYTHTSMKHLSNNNWVI
jgi:hypothetical protein